MMMRTDNIKTINPGKKIEVAASINIMPKLDAFVVAWIRVYRSGKRSMPIAESSMYKDPATRKKALAHSLIIAFLFKVH